MSLEFIFNIIDNFNAGLLADKNCGKLDLMEYQHKIQVLAQFRKTLNEYIRALNRLGEEERNGK